MLGRGYSYVTNIPFVIDMSTLWQDKVAAPFWIARQLVSHQDATDPLDH